MMVSIRMLRTKFDVMCVQEGGLVVQILFRGLARSMLYHIMSSAMYA